jgi:hypothetical protein
VIEESGMLDHLLLAFACLAPGETKVDQTGIRWALPFKEAQKRSLREKRLLLIKPIAFGTEKSGGW